MTPEPLTAERLAAMHAWTCKYGSGNGWTGTTGEAATMIRELLAELRRLKGESEKEFR